MLESGRIRIERGGSQSQPKANPPPVRCGVNDLTKDELGFLVGEIESRRGFQRSADGRFVLIFCDGGLGRICAVNLWDRIQVIGGGEFPAARRSHEKAVVAKVVIVIAGEQGENGSPP